MPSPAKTPRPKRAQNAVQAVGPRRSEHVEAVQFMAHMQMDPLLRRVEPLLHSIPNGGHRNKVVAAKLKAEGQKAGVSDYFLAKPIGPFHGLYLELKAEDGRPTKEQRDWLELVEAEGYAACFAWTAPGAVEAVKRYLAGEWNGDRL